MIIDKNLGYFNIQEQEVIPAHLVFKMKELGIDPSHANNALQAWELIREAMNSEKSPSKIIVQVQNSNENFSEFKKNDTYKKVQGLASKLGINIPDNTPIEKLITILENVIQNLIELAYKKNDLEMLKLLKEYKNELNQIKTAINNSQGEDNGEKLNNYMNILAEQNKTMLLYNNRIA